MSMAHSKTIGEMQAEIEAALARIPSISLSPGLEALKYLLPPSGMSARVSLRHADKQRQIRRTADASYWNARTCELLIFFEQDGDADDRSDADSSRNGSLTSCDPLDDLIKVLDGAEREPRYRDFVGIKPFRDQFLVLNGGAWATDPAVRHVTLTKAIDQGIVLRNSIPNPKDPNHPTTAIRLNREHPEAKRILKATAAERAVFKPVAIRGEKLSSTVLSGRR